MCRCATHAPTSLHRIGVPQVRLRSGLHAMHHTCDDSGSIRSSLSTRLWFSVASGSSKRHPSTEGRWQRRRLRLSKGRQWCHGRRDVVSAARRSAGQRENAWRHLSADLSIHASPKLPRWAILLAPSPLIELTEYVTRLMLYPAQCHPFHLRKLESGSQCIIGVQRHVSC
jgi:hypothetical protein